MLLSSLLLATLCVRAQDDLQVVRFAFKFGFFKDELTPLTEVVKADVEGVLCQTQYFLSQLVQNATDSKSVHAQATNINWGYFEKDELPAHINFTVEFTDAVLQEDDVNWVDDQILIDEMEAMGEAGLQRFITNWVWNAEPVGLNFFANANKMSFDGIKRARIKGDIPNAECPATDAPTMAPTISPAPTTAPSVPPPGGAEGVAGAGDDEDPNGEGTGGPGGDLAGRPNIPGGTNGRPVGNPGDAGTRNDWPFGVNYNTTEDLDPMADFSLAFHMFEDHEKPPTEDEVNALLCQLNEFFTQELRKKMSDDSIHSKAVYIDWYFNEEGAGAKEDIIVNFTSFSYYADDVHSQIPATDVFDAMKLSTSEIDIMVEKYIWMSEPEKVNLFSHTEQVFLNADVGEPLNDQAMMVEAGGCILPPTGEGDGAGSGADDNGNGDGGNGDGSGANPLDDNLGLGGDAKGSQVRVAFRVSNLEDIKEPNAIKAEGLDASFPVFSNEMVNEIAKKDSETRRILHKGRRLRVVAVPGTQKIENVAEYNCPSNALPGLTCHSASATYDVLMSSEEDQVQVQNSYTDGTQTAVDDGTYNNVLQRVDPETPLYIGIMTNKEQIPPGSRGRGYDGEDDEDEGWFKWWYLLILLLLLLLCCLICLYCAMLPKGSHTKEETFESREVMVEEFEDEGGDHGAPGDEEFVDDDGGAMVPYDPDATKDGPMVPYDPDQAKRDEILSGSQRGEER